MDSRGRGSLACSNQDTRGVRSARPPGQVRFVDALTQVGMWAVSYPP